MMEEKEVWKDGGMSGSLSTEYRGVLPLTIVMAGRPEREMGECHVNPPGSCRRPQPRGNSSCTLC